MSAEKKSNEAFRTISEVAKELGLQTHVLRFWESKFPQIKPMKRAGGRRYYRPNDVALLKRLQTLLHDEGYTIKGVQKLFREEGTKKQIALAQQDSEVTSESDPQSAPVDPQESAKLSSPISSTVETQALTSSEEETINEDATAQTSLFDLAPKTSVVEDAPQPHIEDTTNIETVHLPVDPTVNDLTFNDLTPPEPTPLDQSIPNVTPIIHYTLSAEQKEKLYTVLDELKAMKNTLETLS